MNRNGEPFGVPHLWLVFKIRSHHRFEASPSCRNRVPRLTCCMPLAPERGLLVGPEGSGVHRTMKHHLLIFGSTNMIEYMIYVVKVCRTRFVCLLLGTSQIGGFPFGLPLKTAQQALEPAKKPQPGGVYRVAVQLGTPTRRFSYGLPKVIQAVTVDSGIPSFGKLPYAP